MYELCSLSANIDQADEPPPTTAQSPTDSGQLSETSHKEANCFDDWKWQISKRIRDLTGLYELFPNLKNNDFLPTVIKKYPMAITPYYASLIRKLDMSDPVFAMSIPQISELQDPACLSEDPLEENEDMPVPGLIHRYPDRALLIATTTCSMYCRHCTRKRVAGTRESTISPLRLKQVYEYLITHPEIHDVIVSGGDPLTMNTDAIERILETLRSIPSVQIIRIGTRTPVVLPQRITDELVNMLKKYHPLWINTHFNHPNELTKQAVEACTKLADAGIPLGNQSVLLRGVNDTPQVFEQLCRGLVRMRVRPYYLYQCDLVKGIEHFRTPLSRGIEIMEYLRGRLSGIAIPTFVVDAPHGGGKIPVLPNYIVSTSPTHTVLRNFEGMMINYPEPSLGRPAEIQVAETTARSVWDLASGRSSVIVPENIKRYQRRKTIVRKKNASMVQEEFNF
ncbi:MAG TPA: lysine 2,3-aminomutase [Phycisphaerales bacterium]|nr:lysine 2,3-aminomutase [Phycisphaerales bacterium]HBR20900.1 lysine 2,3-aminomutase [Phycisphaerales bacterium]